MAQGLAWLGDWDERDRLSSLQVPVLALAAKDDPIVPEEMSRASFPEGSGIRLDLRDTGGHLLPRSVPSWCAERIHGFLEER